MRQRLNIREILMLKKAHPEWEPDGVNKETWENFLKEQNSFTPPQEVKKVKKVKQTRKATEEGEIHFEVPFEAVEEDSVVEVKSEKSKQTTKKKLSVAEEDLSV